MHLKYLMALLLPALAAAERNYIVTFSSDTPEGVVEEAMAAVKANGGRITHHYTLIKGFSACGPEEAVNQVYTMAGEWTPNVEQDTVVTTQ